ncbi:serine/threonine protein kinase [Ktedonosporobacter rubrisoli]|nr:serine/threonine-protein kinase [Ktedonosporobacter rubrisoli]
MTVTAEKVLPPLRLGTHLGRYHLRRLLKRGGMSYLYLGYDNVALYPVAIKVMEACEPYHRLCLNEVHIMRSLQHKNIIRLLHYGQYKTYSYLVMPYISGGSLLERLAKGPLSPKQAGKVLYQLATALHYLHERRIVHCDIKPANILLEDGHVYLADFGIATFFAQKVIDNGYIRGTPLYMAPEFYNGYANMSCDVYALGVLLYEMLTGQVPFWGVRAQEVYLKHTHIQPAPPSELNSQLSSAIDDVVLRALEKDPHKRFKNTIELAEAYTQAIRFSLVDGLQRLQTALKTCCMPVGRHINVRQVSNDHSAHAGIAYPWQWHNISDL